MRFLIKMAFWLGLIAFFLPSGSPQDPSSHGIDYVTAFLGAQEAMGDLGGFCERSPTACQAGGEIAGFIGARVADGAAYAFALARGNLAAPDAQPITVADSADPTEISTALVADDPSAAGPRPYQAPNSDTDPMATAAVAADAVRRAAGLPPFGSSRGGEGAAQTLPVAASEPASSFVPAIPTPAPRV